MISFSVKKSNLFIVSLFSLEVFYLLLAVFRPFLDFSGIVILEVSLFILQPILLIFSIILAFIFFKKDKVLALTPLITVVLGFFLWSLIVRTDIGPRLYLHFFSKKIMHVVGLVKSNSLPYEQHDTKQYKYMKLPNSFQSATKNGGVSVYDKENNLIVFFYISRTLNGLEGFVYSKNDIPPKKGIFDWEYVSSRKIGANWYWVVFD